VLAAGAANFPTHAAPARRNVSRLDSIDSKARSEPFARINFFPDSFWALRGPPAEFGPRVAACWRGNTPRHYSVIDGQSAIYPLAPDSPLKHYG
jgi:hypothetical protein